MQPTKISPGEIQLIEKELEALGESWEKERLERRSEIDGLKVEVQAIRKALGSALPEFDRAYQQTYQDQLRAFDPESDQPLDKTG